MSFDLAAVKALTFDIFGTVVDWRSALIEEGQTFGRTHGLEIDWAAFALAWRGGYGPAMERVRRGQLPWTLIDDLHRMILDRLLVEFNITGPGEAALAHFNKVWHRLRPWPDVLKPLQRLRRKYLLAPLSNGNMALLTNMAKSAGLPWDCILSAELAQCYKPDPQVYRAAAQMLGLEPGQVLMVAAHTNDLRGAAAAGLRTAFVPRPGEYGPQAEAEKPDPAFDLIAADFEDLARRLGA
ncbi:MAG: haloacid dehalogenase type II [Candidatus Latescibacteria bacterium]|nr:haloacid dehalogenase type II [Candidatus Latescibacterota bacterium]